MRKEKKLEQVDAIEIFILNLVSGFVTNSLNESVKKLSVELHS